MVANNSGGQQDHQADILGQVVLDHFTATPAAIGPFGSTVLSWSASGPAGFRILLNGAVVNRSGQATEQPRVNTSYRLEASAGAARRPLATVPVKVDTSTCAVVQPNFETRKFLLGQIQTAVLQANSALSVRMRRVPTGPRGQSTLEPVPQEIAFSPGLITINLHFAAHVDGLTPDVDVTITLGLRLDGDGALQVLNPAVTGSVSSSWLLDLVPVFGLIVSLKEGAAEHKLPMQFQPVVDAIPKLLSLDYTIDLSRQRYQVVSIPGDPAEPPIHLVACAKPRSVRPIGDLGHDLHVAVPLP